MLFVAGLISFSGGIGGLCRSPQRHQGRVIMAVCVELGASLWHAVRAAFPSCIELGEECNISRRVVEQIISSTVGTCADLWMTGGGFPCQDVSRLHTRRAGMGCGGSLLIRELARVVTAVEGEVDMDFVPHHTRPVLGLPSRQARDSWLIGCESCAEIGISFHALPTSVVQAGCLQA